MAVGEHCWHRTGTQTAGSRGRTVDEACCWCNEKSVVEFRTREKPLLPHGPYLPLVDRTRVLEEVVRVGGTKPCSGRDG